MPSQHSVLLTSIPRLYPSLVSPPPLRLLADSVWSSTSRCSSRLSRYIMLLSKQDQRLERLARRRFIGQRRRPYR
jgi:hypothetical protein